MELFMNLMNFYLHLYQHLNLLNQLITYHLYLMAQQNNKIIQFDISQYFRCLIIFFFHCSPSFTINEDFTFEVVFTVLLDLRTEIFFEI